MGDIIETAKFNRRYETEMVLAAIETIKNFCNNQYQHKDFHQQLILNYS